MGRAVALPASAWVTKPKQGVQGRPMALAGLDQLSLLPPPTQPQPEQRAWGGPDKRERIWSLSMCLVLSPTLADLLPSCCSWVYWHVIGSWDLLCSFLRPQYPQTGAQAISGIYQVTAKAEKLVTWGKK